MVMHKQRIGGSNVNLDGVEVQIDVRDNVGGRSLDFIAEIELPLWL